MVFIRSAILGYMVGFCSTAVAQSDGIAAPYFQDCPQLCQDTGPDPANWTQIHRLDDLEACKNKTTIFDLNVYNPVDATDGVFTIRACSSTGQEIYDTKATVLKTLDAPDNSLTISNACGAKIIEKSVAPAAGHPVSQAPESETLVYADFEKSITILSSFMSKGAQCGATILFAKTSNAVIGMFAESDVAKSSIPGLLSALGEHAQTNLGSDVSLEVCDTSVTAGLTFGVYGSSIKNIGAVQNAVRSWVDGKCLNSSSPLGKSRSMNILVSKEDSNKSSVAHTKRYQPTGSSWPPLAPRGDCRAIQVNSGDGCASLATRCKIPGADITKYNKEKDFCSTLKPKQWICCSAGTLPDMRPKPGSDGTCFTYTIQSGDTCFAVADAHSLKSTDIEGFNKKTWGWNGCNFLQLGQKICLSKGDPPLPAPVNGVQCGPQVLGTKKPASGKGLETLNPCPLNACCDIFGFCGTTADFCTATKSVTGAPGTAKPGTNGCISNCGTKIVRNDKGPSSFKKIGYYEAFNVQRPCLNMDVSSIDTTAFTHIHFAFATVTTGFNVNISDSKTQFSAFTKLNGVKKILSFGGWAFSTDPGTFQRFRDATNPTNRGAFANNLVTFIKSNAIDGLDFDWEYPGAPDIPDITPGSPQEGQNYLDFLTLLKSKLPTGKSISIALPASYWYLKQYPVAKMASTVDYFVYMTYDLHGQWDVGNKWAIPSCAGGNCLRSHVNKTETYNALAMITKAGVDSTKLVVGVTSYGRGFRMSNPSCSGPFCTYTGARDHSNAYPGYCTGTPGYISNAEIRDIIDDGQWTVKTSYDTLSDSNILIYGTGNAFDWVAYMDGDVKSKRIDWVKSLNFAGTTDWAIDLENYTGDGPGDSGDSSMVSLDADVNYLWKLGCDDSMNANDLQKLLDNIDNIPEVCQARFILDILSNELDDSLTEFNDVADNQYDDVFGYYANWVKDSINSQIVAFMEFGSGPGNKYFKCHYQYGHVDDTSSCMGMPHFWDDDYTSTVTYELTDSDGFYDELESDYGIQKEWVKFGDHEDPYTCADPGDLPPRAGTTRCRELFHYRKNFPQRVDGDQVKIANPKDVIEASMGNITALQTTIIATQCEYAFRMYREAGASGSDNDPVVAVSMPVFQLSTSVDNMKQIKAIGTKIRDEERKNLILMILSIVLMVIPFVGEELGPLVGSVTQVARIATIIGEAGNAAVTVADIIEDPLSAPFAILGLLGGIGAPGSKVTETEAFGKAAAARKAMSASKLAKFSQAFKDKDALVQKLVKTCPAN